VRLQNNHEELLTIKFINVFSQSLLKSNQRSLSMMGKLFMWIIVLGYMCG